MSEVKNFKDLKPGDSVSGKDVLVTAVSKADTKSGKPYLRLTVRDSTSEISGNMWDISKALVMPKAGDVVKMTASIDEYQGKPQINVAGLVASTVPASMFVKRTRFDVETLWSEIVDVVGKFTEPLTKYIAEELLLNAGLTDAIKTAPAASKVHNNWVGGLIEHVHSLITIASPVIDFYKARYAPFLSKDKVLFGLIVHDLGKVIEYDISNPAFPMAPLGVLTNHMVLGPVWVDRMYSRYVQANGLAVITPELKLEVAQLMHVLAAHHGTFEWGSPVRPSTLEALLVHHFDNMDSKMMHAIDLIEKGEGAIAGFSERSYFESTQYYRGN